MSTRMRAGMSWLAVVSLVGCLQQGCAAVGLPNRWTERFNSMLSKPAAEDRPRTIDEAIIKAAGGQNLMTGVAGRRMIGNGSIIDGLDLKLTTRQYMRLYLGKLGRTTGDEPAALTWTDGIVPYIIKNDAFDADQIKMIEDAMAEFEKYTCVTFRPATPYDINNMTFFNGTWCYSELGMVESDVSQLLSLAPMCFEPRGVVLHEIAHTLGLIHEHQRPDRDSYIRVYMENMVEGLESQIVPYDASNYDLYGVHYDYNSVMHYGRRVASKSGKDTIVTLDESARDHIGQREELSFYDVKSINFMYNCNAKCRNPPPCQSPCFVNKDCKCFCKEEMPEVCQSKERHCQLTPEDTRCRSAKVQRHCKLSCGLCDIRKPNPPTTPEPKCEDARHGVQCKERASLGWCTDPRFYDTMKANCPETCGHCDGTPRPVHKTTPRPVECTNTNDYECEMRRTWCQKTHRYHYIMQKNCRKMCGLC